MGGEPLLHPNINKILDMTRSIFIHTNIILLTNGILLNNMSDEFWDCCAKNHIRILISKFPLNIDFSKVFLKAASMGVIIRFYGVQAGSYKDMYKMALDINGSQNIKEMHKICWQNKGECNYFQDGKLYKCTTAGNISNFNNYFNTHLEVTSKDYIDIYNIKNNKQIKNYFENPMPFCKYCNIPAQVFNLPFKTSNKEIKEWT